MRARVLEEWTALGRAGTTELAPEQLQVGLRWLYAQAKLPAPVVLVVDSPLAARMAAQLVRSPKRRASAWDEVAWTDIEYTVPGMPESGYDVSYSRPLPDSLTAPLFARVQAQILEQAGSLDLGPCDSGSHEVGYLLHQGGWWPIMTRVCQKLGRQVGKRAWMELQSQFNGLEQDWCRGASMDSRGMTWNLPRPRRPQDNVGKFVGLGSRWDAPVAAGADYLERTGVDVGDAIRTWVALLKVGFWDLLATERIAFVVKKPVTAVRDGRHRLHCEHGPAVTWADGYANYYLEGLSVPEDAVLRPSTLDPDEVLAEPNLEIRRVLMERLGWDPFLQRAELQHEDRDRSGHPRRLLRLPDPQNPAEPLVLVQVACPSTERQYCLRVPPTAGTCAEAVAWTFGLSERGYHPSVET